MALRDTMHAMTQILAGLQKDLGKASSGNKAAAQRVRTGTIRLERIAKVFRKESVSAEKSGQFKRKTVRKKKALRKKK